MFVYHLHILYLLSLLEDAGYHCRHAEQNL